MREQFEDLFRAFFAEVASEVCGQEADAAPLPGFLRRLAVKFVSENYMRLAQARRGTFILLKARNPY